MATQPYSQLGEVLKAAAEGNMGHRFQSELGRQCGVSQPAVNQWITGIKRPDIAHLALLCRLLGLDPATTAGLAGYDAKRLQDVYKIF